MRGRESGISVAAEAEWANGGIKRLFELEFQLQFPYRMDPDMFSLYVP